MTKSGRTGPLATDCGSRNIGLDLCSFPNVPQHAGTYDDYEFLADGSTYLRGYARGVCDLVPLRSTHSQRACRSRQ